MVGDDIARVIYIIQEISLFSTPFSGLCLFQKKHQYLDKWGLPLPYKNTHCQYHQTFFIILQLFWSFNWLSYLLMLTVGC
jgi:hypothetical protein